MNPPRVLASVEDDGLAVVVVEGEIDLANAAGIGEEILAVSSQVPGVCLDLSSVRYLDSAGVRMLFGLARRAEAAHQRLALVLPENSPLRRLVVLTQFDQVVLVALTSEACLEGLRCPIEEDRSPR